jgi:SAM-dependent methyltransferase
MRQMISKSKDNCFNSNYHAPVTKMLEEGITVLDSGCGPATWTLEMGKTYSASKFHGIDITGVFPDTIMPANVEFAIGNIAKTLPYPDNTFDYIHQRLLIAGLTNDNWESVCSTLRSSPYFPFLNTNKYHIIGNERSVPGIEAGRIYGAC